MFIQHAGILCYGNIIESSGRSAEEDASNLTTVGHSITITIQINALSEVMPVKDPQMVPFGHHMLKQLCSKVYY